MSAIRVALIAPGSAIIACSRTRLTEPPFVSLERAEELLSRVFGFASFRPGQGEVIQAVLDGRHVLAVMPTGGGKSLCYQLPALLCERVTLVVSPLIALMRDQVRQLHAFGIAAASLTSANEPGENRRIFDALRAGRLRLLYVAPERLTRPDTVDELVRVGVGLFAVDEAHCVSQWGHDFRPDYLLLREVAEKLDGVPMIALTATADEATRHDIAERLFPSPPISFVRGFDRPNLHLAMAPKTSARRQLSGFIKERSGASGIVYCATRKRTEALAEALVRDGVRALAYHAGLDTTVREANQTAFLQDDGVVMVATVAFGMGIDKPDVRFVCHADLPKTVESYYQEIGRAGRDGLPADTLTLYGLDDLALRRQQIEASEAADEHKRIERQRFNALVALCEAPRCRRQTLLAYFGERSPPCGNCDLCAAGVELIDGTVLAQKAMSAIVRTGQRFGTEHLVSVLIGQATAQVARFGHDRLPTFGVGRDHGAQAWRSIFRQLYGAGLITLDIVRYGRWVMTDDGWAVVRGRARIELRRDAIAAPTRAGGRARDGAAPEPGPTRAAERALALSADDTGLLEALKARRRELARGQGVPAYVIFPDRTLMEIARARPRDLADLAGLHGVGQVKLERYGAAFLSVVEAYRAAADRDPGSDF